MRSVSAASRGQAAGAACAFVAMAGLVALSGCAGTCGTSATGVMLEYRMDEGDVLAYRQSSDMVQTMEVQGQSIPIESNEALEFSLLVNGRNKGLHDLTVTVDGVSVVASTPQGSTEAEASDAIGQSFDMTLTSLGKEGGLPENDEFVYSMEPQGDRSLIPMFSEMFPDLPDHPIEIGDTWPAVLKMDDDTGGTNLSVVIEAVNTLVGFEEFRGYECAKITSVLSGTIEGSGRQNGANWILTSDNNGTGVWYFAYKDGILVSDISEGTATGSITVTAPNGEVTMPVTRVYTMSTELVR